MQNSRWKDLANAVSLLAKNIDDYHGYLKRKAEEQVDRHRSLTPLRSPSDGSSSHVRSIVRASVRSELLTKGIVFKSLCSLLEALNVNI